MKNADFSRKPQHSPQTSLISALVRKLFLFLVARARRSPLAASGAALLALLCARRLLTEAATSRRAAPQATARRGRVLEGEYRRVHETS